MATATVVIVTPTGEVERGIAIPADELHELASHLHDDLNICDCALNKPVDGLDVALAGSGVCYKIGSFNEVEECEFYNHYAARILAKYSLTKREVQ